MTRQPSASRSTIAPLLRAVSQWLIGVALAALLTLFFVAISAVQLSSEGAGQRLLRRSVAVSTDIDAVLPDLQAALQGARHGDRLDALSRVGIGGRPGGHPVLVEPVGGLREDSLSQRGALQPERLFPREVHGDREVGHAHRLA